jgi:hypothetical protein
MRLRLRGSVSTHTVCYNQNSNLIRICIHQPSLLIRICIHQPSLFSAILLHYLTTRHFTCFRWHGARQRLASDLARLTTPVCAPIKTYPSDDLSGYGPIVPLLYEGDSEQLTT